MRRTLLAVFMALLLPSCTDDFEQAAVTATRGGDIRVLYYPCQIHPAPAETVQLLVADNDTVGNGNDTVLWEVRAGHEVPLSRVMSFEPGTVPSGYSETIALRAPNTGDEVSVYITVRDGGSFVEVFRWGSLTEGVLITEEGSKTESEWLKYAAEGCGEDPS
jgi:hypothetical protein